LQFRVDKVGAFEQDLEHPDNKYPECPQEQYWDPDHPGHCEDKPPPRPGSRDPDLMLQALEPLHVPERVVNDVSPRMPGGPFLGDH
jgi:hypothetical protein